MADHAPLVREIARLETLLAQIAPITARDDDGRRRELVERRRELSAQIATIGRLAEPIFADTPELAQYRAMCSRMRSATAAHQASWPAVKLGERPEAFRASAGPMRDANRAFIAWTREALARPD